MGKITLNLVIDEVEKRVVFAEGDRDFVDVLLSFLVLPAGTAVSLAGSKSKIGCINTLYKSVESLNAKHFNKQSCKKMLLYPDRTYSKQPVVKIDYCSSTNNYICPYCYINNGNHFIYSSVFGARCSCGYPMKMLTFLFPKESYENPSNVGVFLRGMNKYLITDDLRISTMGTLSTEELCKHGIYNVERLRQKKVKVGRRQVLNLLKHALLSKSVLTDAFIGTKPVEKTHEETYFKLPALNGNGRKMTMDLIVNKSKRKFLYAFAKEDVANFFFSFLAFPLGLLSNLYNGSSSLGCIDELRSSAKLLGDEGQLITDEYLNILLKPKLSPHHGFEDQILNVEEGNPSFLIGRIRCLAINHKIPFFTTEKGGSFVNGPATFTISDNLEIKPASLSKHLSVIRAHDDIEIIPVELGEKEALKLLHASLTSSTPLSGAYFEELQTNSEEKIFF